MSEQRIRDETVNEAVLPAQQARRQRQLFRELGLRHGRLFVTDDVTAGTENELAVAVTGARRDVDLPTVLRESPHVAALSPLARQALAQWLDGNHSDVWEHSWLRIALDRLHPETRATLDRDLANRADRADFLIDGHTLRVPASYVLRLALVDACATLPVESPLRSIAVRVGDCFLNDNTVPEIVSTHIVDGAGRGIGQAVAAENAQRFLLVQLLTAYANARFGLVASGQSLAIYGAPTPPQRLRALSKLLPPDFYRELMMNPCLAGFRNGDAKRDYMHLCHLTLSRSRQHAQAHLIGAGIIRTQGVERLICDTSLLNNGTHLSLGSRALGRAFAAPEMAGAEKYLGDLVSKVVEHFLPLFVGLYSAAPSRLAPADLRPAQALGFLPNELSAPFLRLTWQSWRRKAGLFSALKGDVVPDARLIDYFAALPSQPGQAVHDGRPGNGERLKAMLELHGLYSSRMTVYTLYRLREQAKMGYSGFEGRHHSLFPSFADDLAPAAELQALVTAVACDLIARGEVIHAGIPDDPETESERRQLFFAAAAGLPVAYVRRQTRNHFLLRVLAQTQRTRPSKRYPQYFKVYLDDYRAALARELAIDAQPVMSAPAQHALNDLQERLARPDERGAAGSVMRGVLSSIGARQAMDVDAATFNDAAGEFYRETLRERQMIEGIEACQAPWQAGTAAAPWIEGGDAARFMARTRSALLRESASTDTLRSWIGLVLANVAAQS